VLDAVAKALYSRLFLTGVDCMNARMPVVLRLLVIFCLLAGSPANASSQSENLAAAVDTVFAPLDRADAPGCAVGVMRSGELVYKAAYGMASLELGVPLTADSIFRIASVSKQFTAAAVLLLAEDGVIDLDEDVRKYLPGLVDYGSKVPVRAMLGHVSGIPDYESVLMPQRGVESTVTIELKSVAGGPFRMGNEDYLSIDEFYDVARMIPLRHAPLTAFEYSNTAYFLLSMLVEKTTGQTLRQFAEQRIFGPLGMKHSFYSDNPVEVISQRATGYVANESGGYDLDMTNLYWVGDGGVHTSINDFVRWDRNFYQPQLGRDPAEFVRQMNTPNSQVPDEGALHANGQSVRTSKNHGTVYSHSGGWLGFSTYYVRYPEYKFSTVIFCNDAMQDPAEYAQALVERLLPPGRN
jgi:CubicO group peptidase (beta-lactamase class C family)